jgi:hypothetical protein
MSNNAWSWKDASLTEILQAVAGKYGNLLERNELKEIILILVRRIEELEFKTDKAAW